MVMINRIGYLDSITIVKHQFIVNLCCTWNLRNNLDRLLTCPPSPMLDSRIRTIPVELYYSMKTIVPSCSVHNRLKWEIWQLIIGHNHEPISSRLAVKVSLTALDYRDLLHDWSTERDAPKITPSSHASRSYFDWCIPVNWRKKPNSNCCAVQELNLNTLKYNI